MASCRRAEAAGTSAPVHCAGFTLIEILVVLAILAGLTAIALPQLTTLYARVRASFDREDLEQQLYALPQLVRGTGRAGILAATPDPTEDAPPPASLDDGFSLERPQILRLDVPAGWRVQVPRPILYHFTGACDGGVVLFSLPPVVMRYRLDAPLCLPRLAHDQ